LCLCVCEEEVTSGNTNVVFKKSLEGGRWWTFMRGSISGGCYCFEKLIGRLNHGIN